MRAAMDQDRVDRLRRLLALRASIDVQLGHLTGIRPEEAAAAAQHDVLEFERALVRSTVRRRFLDQFLGRRLVGSR